MLLSSARRLALLASCFIASSPARTPQLIPLRTAIAPAGLGRLHPGRSFAPGNQFECAVVVELPGGSYTAVIEPGFSAAAGVATAEIYELP